MTSKATINLLKAELKKKEAIEAALEFLENEAKRSKAYAALKDQIVRAQATLAAASSEIEKAKKSAADTIRTAGQKAKAIEAKALEKTASAEQQLASANRQAELILAKANEQATDIITVAQKKANDVSAGLTGRLKGVKEDIAAAEKRQAELHGEIKALTTKRDAITADLDRLKERIS